LPGGRKSWFARAVREHALAQGRRRPGDPPITFDETLERHWASLRSPAPDPLTAGISRRDLLKAGGVLGAGLALAACTTGSNAAPSPASPGSPPSGTPHDARVVVVGAGLAGTTAAYRLMQVGIRSDLYEARDRIGGRCWTARGFAQGQTAEHGGEFIDSRHVHLLRLAKELRLEVEDLYPGYRGSWEPIWLDGGYVTHAQLHPDMERVRVAVTAMGHRIGVYDAKGNASDRAISYGTATPGAVAVDRLSMAEWLDRNVEGFTGSPAGRWYDEAICGWYGLDTDQLSALNLVDWFLIPAPGADERWHVKGGNDQVTAATTAALPDDSVHTNTVLRAIRATGGGGYELTFDGAGTVAADLLILTLPFTTLRQVDLSEAGFGPQTTAAIDDLAMGYDAKVLVQYDARPHTMHDWDGTMESIDPNWDTWESSVNQPGTNGIVTVYAGGRTGAGWSAPEPHGEAPAALRDQVLDRIDEAIPGSKGHALSAWADLWPRDAWTNGAYAAFGIGQYTRFWGGTARADGNAHFAGEATSTYSQGYLNGGVESGDRAATEVMQAMGVTVPPALARLPH
jgi:monoamine oxidase